MIKQLTVVAVCLALIQTTTAHSYNCGFPTCPQVYQPEPYKLPIYKAPLYQSDLYKLPLSKEKLPLLSGCLPDAYKFPLYNTGLVPKYYGGFKCKPSLCDIIDLKLQATKDKLDNEKAILKKLLCCSC